MSPEQSSNSASKKGKKPKQKSTGNTPASTGEAQIESNAPTKENPTVETSKTQKKGKSKDKARTEAKVSEGITSTSASEPQASQKSKKAKAKEPSPSPLSSEVEAAEEAAADASEQSGDDEDEHLHGFSTDDDDSSDEEDAMDEEATPFDISKLPTIAKDDATIKRKLEKAKRQPTQDRGVIYIGRVPHGFYEDQMRGYFSQFGNVTRVRLSRNKKTGRSKHYGFVEFDSSSVAQIVAETMDNYLLTGSILRCKVIPKDEVHPELWVGANRKWRVVPRDRLTRVKHNKTRTEDEQARATKRLIKRQNQRKRKLAEAGIKYDFEDASY
ncbi:hypothetical protein H0H93_005925, partial [Arthromyces matolae]